MVYISEFLSDAELRHQLSSYVSLLNGQEKALQQREAAVHERKEVLAKREAELLGLTDQMGTVQVSSWVVVACYDRVV